jgi:hypothetical protein
VATKEEVAPFKFSSLPGPWYKALGDVGYNFGASFQKQLEVESVAGKRSSRVRVSFSEPESFFAQSTYPVHPASMDACFQGTVPALWSGYRTSIDVALVPRIIDDLTIHSRLGPLNTGVALSVSEYTGVGSLEIAKSYKSHVTVYDGVSMHPILDMRGLHYNELSAYKPASESEVFARLSWKPDITLLAQDKIQKMMLCQLEYLLQHKFHESTSRDRVGEILDLFAHRKPNLSVVEINTTGSSYSAWLDQDRCDMDVERFVSNGNRTG